MPRPEPNSKSFHGPTAISPIAAVYRLLTTVGLAKGHEPHVHPDTVEICFLARGHLEWWIGETPYEVGSGDVMVVPPGAPHGSVDSTLQPCEYYAVHVRPQELSREIAAALLAADLPAHHPGASRVGETLQRVFHEHEQRDDLSPELCRSYVCQMVAELARGTAAAEGRRVSPLVERAREHLVEILGASSPVEETARQLGCSVAWLTRRFRQETGESPGEWLRGRRIIQAKQMLALESVAISEIALRLGFGSSQYFATAFRHSTGIAPSEYRQRCLDSWGSERLERVAVAPGGVGSRSRV